MAEVLSQQEIDQLLNNVKSGQEVEKPQGSEAEVIPFDFRLPNRISNNQSRSIRNIHESFGESFASYLVSKLQTIVTINVTSVDQIYYSEYVLSVSNPACLYTFDIKNSDIKGIVELNTDFALSLVDRLLGGNGLGTKSTKVITPIEQKVLATIAERIMLDLKKSWQIVGNYEFQLERFESDIDFAQITSPSESVMLISFEVIIGEQSFMMNLCFATYSFDNLLSKLSSQRISAVRPVKYHGTTSAEILSSHLYKTDIPVVVEFGKGKITMQELTELEKGDIIKLDTKITDEQIVKVAGKIMFTGKSGVVNNHKAIKVSKKLFSEEL